MAAEPDLAPPAPNGKLCELCGGARPSSRPRYCCDGCMRVAEILAASGYTGEAKHSGIWKQAALAGLVPRRADPGMKLGASTEPGSADPTTYRWKRTSTQEKKRVNQASHPRRKPDFGVESGPTPPLRPIQRQKQEVSFDLEGLWCPSCAWLIEATLVRLPGVARARSSFLTESLHVLFDPSAIGRNDLVRQIEQLGYRVVHGQEKSPVRGPLLRFGIAAFFTANVMMLSYSFYAVRWDAAPQALEALLPWILAALSAPVVFGCGYPILRRAWLALRARAVTMDTLIALGSVSAFLFSTAAVLRGNQDVYFDGACALITFWLLGRVLEQSAFARATCVGQAVRRLLPRKARKLVDSQTVWVSTSQLKPGDRIQVAPGERIPVDARVLSETGRISTAVIDGEPRPRLVQAGARVQGGSVCGETRLEMEVLACADKSMLAKIAEHVARASGKPREGVDLADALARLFLPLVLVLSAVTGAAMLGSGSSLAAAFERALSVLVVSCPCALGIAAPLARVIAAGALARRGVIVRREDALEDLATAEWVAFDKTGTLTEGRLDLQRIEVQGATKQEVLHWASVLETASGHPIAMALRRAEEKDLSSHNGHLSPHTSVPGKVLGSRGVTGFVHGHRALLGRPQWVEDLMGPIPGNLEQDLSEERSRGRTAILFATGDGTWGLLAFGDSIRPEARATVDALRSAGLRTAIISGDSREATEACGRSVGADFALGDHLPEEKAQWLETQESESGRTPIFVGDGINDAPALAASVGIAVASGADFARETADILFAEKGLQEIVPLIRTAGMMRSIIRQNLIWAALYNAVAIPAAISGLLTPVFAAGAMVTSGLLVTFNALRLRP